MVNNKNSKFLMTPNLWFIFRTRI